MNRWDDFRARPGAAAVIVTYAKCPDCTCRSYCLRDGKLIVDLARLRSGASTSDPEARP